MNKKHTGDCLLRHSAFICTTHQLNKTICKCEKKAVKIQSNSCINSTILGNVGFDTEMIVIRNGQEVDENNSYL